MYEVIVTPEFERWFEALDSGIAEKVATALDVIESAGPALDPVKASRLLLWYDGMVGPPWSQGLVSKRLATHGSVEGMRRLLLWREELVRCLDSPLVRARLTQVDRALAARALQGIKRIRASLAGVRVWMAYGAAEGPKEAVLVGPEEEITISNRLLAGLDETPPGSDPSIADRPSDDPLRRGLIDVLALLGLEPGDLVDTTSGLREVTITAVAPHLRLVYGIDVDRRRVLAILGEPLDRAYYGDSVRLAEQRWREYCASPQPAESIDR